MTRNGAILSFFSKAQTQDLRRTQEPGSSKREAKEKSCGEDHDGLPACVVSTVQVNTIRIRASEPSIQHSPDSRSERDKTHAEATE